MTYERFEKNYEPARLAPSSAMLREVISANYQANPPSNAPVDLPDLMIYPQVESRHHKHGEQSLSATPAAEKIDEEARKKHIEGEILAAKQNGVEEPEKYVASERKRLEEAYSKDPDSLERERKELQQKMNDGKMTPSEQVTLFMIYDIESEHYQAKAK